MNLHGIVAPYVAAVNPMVAVSVQISNGSDTNPDGSQTPAYRAAIAMRAQVQALTYRDLTQIASLNLQGTRRAIYLFGDIEGIVRLKQQGGDLITFPNGDVYLVALVLETWGDANASDRWCKVAATLQTAGSS